MRSDSRSADSVAPVVPMVGSPNLWFTMFCLVHLVVWTLAPALMNHIPPFDSLEGIAWGNMWQLGYDKHPFLAPWFSALFTNFFGVVGWPIYLLGQLSVIVCFLAVWALARAIVDPWQALIAVVLLDGIYYYNESAIDFNPNVLMLPTWALSTVTFYFAVRAQSIRRWIPVGVCAGLAALAKYESAILFVAMIGVLAFTVEGRSSFRSPGFYLAVAAAMLVMSPNLYWMAGHGFAPLHYAMNNLQLEHVAHPDAPRQAASIYTPLLFLLEQAGALSPLLLLYAPLFKWRNRSNALNQFDQRFVLFMAAGPLLITLLFAIVSNATLIARWATPFFSCVGLALVMFIRTELTHRRLLAFFGAVAVVNALMIAHIYWVIFVRPEITHIAPNVAFPGSEIASKLTQDWHARYRRPLKFVAGDRHLLSAICAFSTDKPVPYFRWNEDRNLLGG